MIKTTQKATEEKKGFDLKEAFVLWRKQSKVGKDYLTGFVSKDQNVKLVGYFNTDKKNPKEPDVRVYQSIKNEDGTYSKSEKEVASLWIETSKNENQYYTGLTDENERLIAFVGDVNKELRPYIRAYFKEN
jgi:hypothetical protein